MGWTAYKALIGIGEGSNILACSRFPTLMLLLIWREEVGGQELRKCGCFFCFFWSVFPLEQELREKRATAGNGFGKI